MSTVSGGRIGRDGDKGALYEREAASGASAPEAASETPSLDVYVVVDMILAIAVVAIAFGAVAKFHVGKVGIGLAAYGAFVDITLLLLSLPGGLLEVHRLLGVLVLIAPLLPPHGVRQVRPEEEQEVEDGHQREEGADKLQADQAGDHLEPKNNHVGPGQPLDLDGDDEEQQDLHVRIENSKGEEQGKIKKVDAGVTGDEPVEDVEPDAQQVKRG